MTIDELSQKITTLEQKVAQLSQRRIYQRDVITGEIKQQAIDGIIIFRWVTADRPSTGSTEIQCFYDETLKRLSIWNTTNDAWEYEDFT